MEIIFLGSTAAVPTSKRGHPSIALRYGGEIILWDCGEGVQRQLIKSKTSYMKITKIFITHLHGDHFLGLPGLIQTLSFSGREEPLTIFGPPGIKKLVKRITKLGYFDLAFNLKVKEIYHNFEHREKNYFIKAFKVIHGVPTFGLAFQELKKPVFLREKAKALGIPPGPLYARLKEGKDVKYNDRIIKPGEVLGKAKRGIKVVYSSDTRPCDTIRENAGDSLLIHDGTFQNELISNAKENLHSTVEEAAELAAQGKARSLYLTHISPRYKDPEFLLEHASAIFKNSYIAKDLEVVDVKKMLDL